MLSPSCSSGMRSAISIIVFNKFALLLVLGLLVACSKDKQGDQLANGGAFVWPDSGYIYDGGTRVHDAGAPDSGPLVCTPPCATSEICACLLNGGGNCGCHEPQGFRDRCDPQVPASCKTPFDCVKARVASGPVYLCSDGRVGAPCSKTEESCNTSNGCVCLSTPFGVACQCQGAQTANPLLCDPQVPESCPDGTCVRVDSGTGPFHLCSDGSEHEPCELGDGSCRTSLGCTCPFEGSKRVCRCSEPGDEPGDACDPTVTGSCVDGMSCETRGNPIEGGYNSECVPAGTMGGMTNPFDCDPNAPMCPPGFDCEEVEPGSFRCRHR